MVFGGPCAALVRMSAAAIANSCSTPSISSTRVNGLSPQMNGVSTVWVPD